MQQIPLVDLKGQYQKIKSEIDTSIAAVLESCQFINGSKVHAFCDKLSDFLSVEYVIPCANGTDALQIALMALELSPGDEIITTPFTFVATAEVIALLGLKPVFVDVNPCTFVINEFQIEQVITEKTKAIIPVHLFGQAANMEAILSIAEKYDLKIIEDNAQAIGADYIFSDGTHQKLGTIGHIGTTSFFPSKNLGCYGDGGAIFTNDEDVAKKIKTIANHGSDQRYYHTKIGVNSRLDSIQAAILEVKLEHLNTYNKARAAAADRYDEGLRTVRGITIPRRARYSTHVFHQYTLLVEHDRDQLQQALSAAGISSGVYYPVPLHLQTAYQQHYPYKRGDFPVAEWLSKQVLSLPMHSELTADIQTYIIKKIKAILGS